MKIENIVIYVLLFVVIILIIVSIVFSIMSAVKEHEFITDLTSIRLHDGNELTDALCQISYCKTHPDDTTNCKAHTNLDKLPDILYALGLIVKSEVKHSPQVVPGLCKKLSSKQLNHLKTRYSFTKLEAEQIYADNQFYINYIYGNHEGRHCMKNLFSLLNPLLKARKTPDHMFSEEEESISEFVKCYNKLSSINKKYIDIILPKIFVPVLPNLFN